MSFQLQVNGEHVELGDDAGSLLEVLRDRLGLTAAKDGCSPQGQCGCCTVLVDGSPRVACVTPARRVAGREITTLEGLDPATTTRWADAFTAAGASQCGFCTPGIIVRLAALKDTKPQSVEQALLAHLCRCTGWRTILDAAAQATADDPAAMAAPSRDLEAAARRAGVEGGVAQDVGAHVTLGGGGFADDAAPPDALVAVPDGRGGWAVAETLTEARRRAGKVQGRKSGSGLTYPIEVPPGEWAITLRTTWVEPAYVEPDSSWCIPGGEPASPLGNGGAFGGKCESIAPTAAKQLAEEHGRPVRVLLAREDTVRLGPKRPPLAAGLNADGSGIIRVARTPGITDAIKSVSPDLMVEEVDVAGPPTSTSIRAAGWAEAAVLLAAIQQPDDDTTTVTAPNGARATARIDGDGEIHVTVRCGDPLDHTVLRSYCIGAAHMALGWVTSEAISVDASGEPNDLTIRSFGILRAKDMPPVHVEIDEDDGPAVNGSDAVFAAVAAATWRRHGYAQDWPTHRGGSR